MIFEIYALVGLMAGIVLLLNVYYGDDSVPAFLLGYVGVSALSTLCAFICAKEFAAEIWIGYGISWAVFFGFLIVTYIIATCGAAISERHLWAAQKRIRQLERQISEKQERETLLKQLGRSSAC